MTTFVVSVEVATVWSSPDAPRPLDAPAVADEPDLAAWTQALDTDTDTDADADAGAEARSSVHGRSGLHGRTLTQLLSGEPVEIVERGPAGWVKVVAPWQPAPEDPRGYPGWVRTAHLTRPDSGHGSFIEGPTAELPREISAILDLARRFLGLAYLWGGTSPWGFDCSGLVHYCHRQAGVVVPRDAAAQRLAAESVTLGDERPGDLYFFARRERVHHVGFILGDGLMLHAPEDRDGSRGRGRIEAAALSGDRRATLHSAGRFALLV